MSAFDTVLSTNSFVLRCYCFHIQCTDNFYINHFLRITYCISIAIKPQRLITSFKTKLHNNQNRSRFSSGLKHKLRLKTPAVQFNQINLFLSYLVMVSIFCSVVPFREVIHTLLRGTAFLFILFFISCKIITAQLNFLDFIFKFFFQFGLK